MANMNGGNDWRTGIFPQVEDEAVFTGPMFRKYLLRQARRCCDKKRIGLTVVSAPQKFNIGGWTDGDNITINAACSVIATCPKTELKVLSMIGTLAHECGHINYSDMKKRRLYARGIENGILYPEMPKASDAQEKAALSELGDCLMKKEEKEIRVLQKALLTLHNIMEDIYIEARQCARFKGIVQKAIRFDSRWSTERAASIRQMQNAGRSELEIMQNVILHYLRTGKVNDWENAGKKYRDILEVCKDRLEQAVTSYDPDSRFRAANQLLLTLWSFVRQEFDREDFGICPMPEYDGQPETNEWQEEEKTEASGSETEEMEAAVRKIRTTGKITGAKELVKALEKIWKAEAAEVAKRLAVVHVKVSSEKTAAVDPEDIHRGHEICLNREKPDPYDRKQYERMRGEVTQTVEKMIRRVQPLLAEQDVSWEKGLAQGKRMNQKGLYRMDNRVFCRRNVPGELKPVAVTVLLDESGSMDYDGKIEAAGRTALILYLFCRRLHIPVRIVGHSTGEKKNGRESVELYSYTEFDSADPLECCRLMKIKARECNRDGAALAYAGEELYKRSETVKLLFVITDGNPYAQYYAGEAAINDTKAVKKKLTRKGIHVIAAAIGDDREDIERIYGEGFLNISDLKRLPDALAALIGRYLERQAV